MNSGIVHNKPTTERNAFTFTALLRTLLLTFAGLFLNSHSLYADIVLGSDSVLKPKTIEVNNEKQFDDLIEYASYLVEYQRYKRQFFLDSTYLFYLKSGLRWVNENGNKQQYYLLRFYESKYYLEYSRYGSYIAIANELINADEFIKNKKVLYILEELKIAYLRSKKYADLLQLYPKYYEINKLHDRIISKEEYLEHKDMSYIHYHLFNYEKAIEYGRKRLKEELNSGILIDISSSYNDLGIFFQAAGNWDSALKYYDKSIDVLENQLFPSEGGPTQWSNNFYLVVKSNRADYYIETGQYEEALPHYFRELVTIKKFKSVSHIAKCYYLIALVYYKQNKLSLSQTYVDSSIYSNTISDNPRIMVDVYNLQGLIHYANQRIEEGEKWSQKSRNLYDSILHSIVSMDYITASAQYEVEKKDAELQLAEQKVITQKNRTLYITVGLIGLGITAVILFFFYRKVSKDKKVISKQRQEAIIAVAEKEVLIKEIHHRVKNNLQIVSGLLDLHSNKLRDERISHAVQEAQRSIHSMALVHQLLYKKNTESIIDLREYISSLLASVEQSQPMPNVKSHLSIDPIQLSIDSAIPIGLITTELITNTFKHAFVEGEGDIYIDIKTDGNLIRFWYRDNGKGISNEISINKDTLGLRLVHLLAEELGSKLHYFNENGFNAKIDFTDSTGLNG
ncbi:tetratricopeptide repeat protein [bacterium]|nr:tetratricopeptide repeat protein [bacterium]